MLSPSTISRPTNTVAGTSLGEFIIQRFLTPFRLLAGLALAVVTVGAAGASSATLTVSPGARVCLQPLYANVHVDASGTAKPGVRFILNRSSDDVNYSTIYQTADTTTGFHAIFDRSSTPAYFPGYFKLCARNVSTTQRATVSLSLTGY